MEPASKYLRHWWDVLTFDVDIRTRHGMVTVIWRVVLVGFIAFSLGWFIRFGFGGFARASEVPQQIEQANRPLVAKVDRLSRLVEDKIAGDAVNEMRSLRRRYCELTDKGDKDRLAREIDRQNELFASIRKTQYAVPRCEDL